MAKFRFKAWIAIFILSIVMMTASCQKDQISPFIEDSISVYDALSMNDVFVTLTEDAGDFITISGHNIASGDYLIEDRKITFHDPFLYTLDLGTYEFVIYTTLNKIRFRLTLEGVSPKHLVLNGGFETGDLTGWTAFTIFKGETQIQAFIDEGVKENGTFFSFEAPYRGDGQYVYGFDDRDGIDKDRWNERIGMLRSTPFELGGSGTISLKLGGGKNPDLAYVSIKRLSDRFEVFRLGNHMFNQVPYVIDDQINPDYYEANLVQYKVNLKPYVGEKLFIEIHDRGGRDWDLLTFDSFITYYKDSASLPLGIDAIDIRPLVSTPSTPVYSLFNGDFSQGLEGWTVSGSNTAFRMDGNVLKSNLDGDASRGLIRSRAFMLDPMGSGMISFRLGAAKGSRFDKDTYISIREVGSNDEVARYANVRHNGTELIYYVGDLSAHKGKWLYIEIVDNATQAWDTIFVSEMVTHYPDLPPYSDDQLASNLAY